MGTGTTGVACKLIGRNFIGSEISKTQVEYSNKRIENILL
jgi:DNA modification methylase